jgi:hypothetical protein
LRLTVNQNVPGSIPGGGVYKYPKKYENIMENLRIRCKSCNRELEGNTSKTVSCGCSNMATIVNNSKITALDLSNVVMLNSPHTKQTNRVLTNDDIMWQEARRQRKVRRLDFEVR